VIHGPTGTVGALTYRRAMSDAQPQRPTLAPTLSGTELTRWYWLTSELVGLARLLGVSTGGSKQELTNRLAATLDGQAPLPHRHATGATGDQLSGEVSASTIIPPGQRSSQELRAWFRACIGPSFRFDRHMREFIQSADGTTTLGDAVRHWEATRGGPATAIDPQFEFNRFTRAWWQSNPSGQRGELLAQWAIYRSRPVDARDRV
jgi:hypothetical protein